MGNRTTLAPAPPRVSGLRDYRTLTLPAIPKPPHDRLERTFRRYDPREDAADLELLDVCANDDDDPTYSETRTTGRKLAGTIQVYGTGHLRRVPGADGEQRARAVAYRLPSGIVIPAERRALPGA